MLSSIPTTPVSKVYWQEFAVKKTAHMVEYGVFSLLIFRGFVNSGFGKKTSFKYSFLISVLYGISDEFHQSFTPGREPTVRDVIFDTIGSALILIYLWRLQQKAPRILKNLAKKLQVN